MANRFNFDLLMLTATRARLQREARDHLWRAYLRAPDGTISTLSGLQQLPKPWAPQEVFCSELANALQQALHHDGAWIVMLSAPIVSPLWKTGIESRYQNITVFWVDADGDIQFPWEIDDRFEALAAQSMDRWLEDAEKSWQNWHFHMRTVPDTKKAQTFKKAQGQLAPSDA